MGSCDQVSSTNSNTYRQSLKVGADCGEEGRQARGVIRWRSAFAKFNIESAYPHTHGLLQDDESTYRMLATTFSCNITSARWFA